MRRLIPILLSVGAIACESGTATRSTVIDVVVRDDRGVPVMRMPVSAMLSTTRVDVSTGSDGTAEIRVPDAGTYLVRVTPRAGYVGSTPGLEKSVSVDTNDKAAVHFTVHRDGVQVEWPPTADW